MANNLVQAEANRWIDASMGTATYTAPTGPMKLRLMSTTGTNTSAGTEVTGGSYVSQTIVTTGASAGSAPNTSTITYTAMPAITTTGVEIWDSAGSPRRQWTGALTASKTTGSGDTLSLAASALTLTVG